MTTLRTGFVNEAATGVTNGGTGTIVIAFQNGNLSYIGIQNNDLTANIYVGFENTTDLKLTGIKIEPGKFFAIDNPKLMLSRVYALSNVAITIQPSLIYG